MWGGTVLQIMMTGKLENKDTSYFEMGTIMHCAKKVITGSVYLRKEKDLKVTRIDIKTCSWTDSNDRIARRWTFDAGRVFRVNCLFQKYFSTNITLPSFFFLTHLARCKAIKLRAHLFDPFYPLWPLSLAPVFTVLFFQLKFYENSTNSYRWRWFQNKSWVSLFEKGGKVQWKNVV